MSSLQLDSTRSDNSTVIRKYSLPPGFIRAAQLISSNLQKDLNKCFQGREYRNKTTPKFTFYASDMRFSLEVAIQICLPDNCKISLEEAKLKVNEILESRSLGY
jgi:hypothetical protein